MARLTNLQKSVLVNRIMEDVPKVDYLPELEKIVKDTAFDLLPPEIKFLPKDIFKEFVGHDYFYSQHYYELDRSHAAYLPNGGNLFARLKESLGKNERYTELIALGKAQKEMLRDIENEVSPAVYACNTDKQLTERYPEFAKYLPTKNETVNLPTVPIIEHLKAVGWKV